MFQVVFLSHHETSALMCNSELTSLSDTALSPREFKRLTWSFIRLISGETTSTMFFSRVGSTQEYTIGKAWNTTDFPNPVGRFTKTSLFVQKQIARLPLDAYWGYQTWKLHTLSWTQPPFFNTHLRELHARFLRVTSSDMQGEMWLVYKSWRHGNRSRGSSSQTLFSAETSDSQKYVCVRRLNYDCPVSVLLCSPFKCPIGTKTQDFKSN